MANQLVTRSTSIGCTHQHPRITTHFIITNQKFCCEKYRKTCQNLIRLNENQEIGCCVFHRFSFRFFVLNELICIFPMDLQPYTVPTHNLTNIQAINIFQSRAQQLSPPLISIKYRSNQKKRRKKHRNKQMYTLSKCGYYQRYFYYTNHYIRVNKLMLY